MTDTNEYVQSILNGIARIQEWSNTHIADPDRLQAIMDLDDQVWETVDQLEGP